MNNNNNNIRDKNNIQIHSKINKNISRDEKLMNKYKDKKNIHEIKQYVKNIKTVGGVINYVDSLYKGWIIGFYDTSDPKILKIWNNTVTEMLNKKTKNYSCRFYLF